MKIAKYITLSTNLLYLQNKHSNSMSIWEKQRRIGSNDYTITGNLSITRSIRKTQHYLVSYLWYLKQSHNQIQKLTWSITRFVPGYLSISNILNKLF